MSNFILNLQQSLLQIYGKFMLLKLFVDTDDNEMINKYIDAVNTHHNKLLNNIHHFDAGLDLFAPGKLHFTQSQVNKLDYKVSCSAKIYEANNSNYNTGFYMYPRSSISKSNIRLANNVGIIDSGYRGHLMGMFDVIYANHSVINKFDRHLQICAPGLIPIVVELVSSSQELGEETARGNGGFGSTGI
jgi:dUTP pyrophosphatase